MNNYIEESELVFLEEAKKWRDEVRSKGKEPYTYRNKDLNYIALFDGNVTEVFKIDSNYNTYIGGV